MMIPNLCSFITSVCIWTCAAFCKMKKMTRRCRFSSIILCLLFCFEWKSVNGCRYAYQRAHSINIDKRKTHKESERLKNHVFNSMSDVEKAEKCCSVRHFAAHRDAIIFEDSPFLSADIITIYVKMLIRSTDVDLVTKLVLICYDKPMIVLGEDNVIYAGPHRRIQRRPSTKRRKLSEGAGPSTAAVPTEDARHTNTPSTTAQTTRDEDLDLVGEIEGLLALSSAFPVDGDVGPSNMPPSADDARPTNITSPTVQTIGDAGRLVPEDENLALSSAFPTVEDVRFSDLIPSDVARLANASSLIVQTTRDVESIPEGENVARSNVSPAAEDVRLTDNPTLSSDTDSSRTMSYSSYETLSSTSTSPTSEDV